MIFFRDWNNVISDDKDIKTGKVKKTHAIRTNLIFPFNVSWVSKRFGNNKTNIAMPNNPEIMKRVRNPNGFDSDFDFGFNLSLDKL